jgi:hypothetical protein
MNRLAAALRGRRLAATTYLVELAAGAQEQHELVSAILSGGTPALA